MRGFNIPRDGPEASTAPRIRTENDANSPGKERRRRESNEINKLQSLCFMHPAPVQTRKAATYRGGGRHGQQSLKDADD